MMPPAPNPVSSSASREVVVITGLSGAGKQLASQYFEDMGYRVVDNLPPRLLPLVVQTDDCGDDETAKPLCLVCDVRGGNIAGLLPGLDALRESGAAPSLLFLDASDEALVRRFKETRRTHPLFLTAGGILPAIHAERELLGEIRGRADTVMDTSDLAPSDLRARLRDVFALEDAERNPHQHPLTVTVASFGFKHGSPLDADLVFDVRFLRNPHYVDELRPFDGRNPAVEAYVMDDERTPCFLERLYDLVGWTLPHYIAEGKAYLTISIGCTGGRHRSVVVAEKLGRFLSERGYPVLIQHRDAGKGG